jgi:hypothetical protein
MINALGFYFLIDLLLRCFSTSALGYKLCRVIRLLLFLTLICSEVISDHTVSVGHKVEL